MNTCRKVKLYVVVSYDDQGYSTDGVTQNSKADAIRTARAIVRENPGFTSPVAVWRSTYCEDETTSREYDREETLIWTTEDPLPKAIIEKQEARGSTELVPEIMVINASGKHWSGSKTRANDAPMDDRQALKIEIDEWSDGDNWPVGAWAPIAKDAGVLDDLLALDAEELEAHKRGSLGWSEQREDLAREMTEQVLNASRSQIAEYIAFRDDYLTQ